MAFMAGDVKLIDSLRDPLKTIRNKSQGSLSDFLGKIGAQQKTSATASGRVPSAYAPAELGRAGTRASTGIEDMLSNALGGTSYDEILKQKEHERNMALAKEIGDLQSPSTWEQVLSGLGGGARAGGQFYSLYNSLNRPSDPMANVYGNV